MMQDVYTSDFFAGQRPASLESARQVVPVVIDLVRPTSVIDVGCGVGTWLLVFKEHGLSDFVGIDGDYIDQSRLMVEPCHFIARDLAAPFRMDRKFDLAVSLEVAEHLPVETAATFVASLAQLAPVVLFSAAVPGQKGSNHVNEQWPSYWVSLFAERGYEVIDAVRPALWTNANVAWWYAQNTLLFAKSDAISLRPRWRAYQSAPALVMDMVHPRMYEEARRPPPPPRTRELLAMLPRTVGRSLAHRLRLGRAE